VHRADPFQAVCMPYFGATTLDDVFRAIQSGKALPTSGAALVKVLSDRQGCKPAVPGGQGTSTLKVLERLSYVDAILGLAVRLAYGLAHAHERGILHRDLKPANILVTDDGQPMLLDFNLSEDTKLPLNASTAQIGGTLPYMAPEQLDALREEETRIVDARGDL